MHRRSSLAAATHAAEAQSSERVVRPDPERVERYPEVDSWRLLVWMGRAAAVPVAFLVSFYAATFALSIGDRPACTRDGSVVTCLRTPFAD